jgi:two-component system chemotaxis response regulator CheB
MPTIRVLVVEDSPTVRARLCRVLDADPDVEVVGQAGDGKQAIALCEELRPDVITMDMMLPVMSGLAAIEYIMAHCPTPILIVSASVNRGELFKTYEALAAGAVDVMDKPRGDDSDRKWEQDFIATVTLVARIRVITHLRARLQRPDSIVAAKVTPTVPIGRGEYALVAIGASTGGPAAIVEVLRGLPATFSLPVIVVMHLGPTFSSAFADWLDGQTSRRVSYAVGGESLREAKGRVIMAPPDRHLFIRNRTLELGDGPGRTPPPVC